jgi:hypothetical protein
MAYQLDIETEFDRSGVSPVTQKQRAVGGYPE